MFGENLKSDPLISVVIPCYNSEQFIGETVESALAQTFKNYEVILIDDGSTDKTPEILKSFERQERIRVVYSRHRGASAARNEGTQFAKGEFFQYLDSDDLLPEEALAKRVQVITQSHADVVYSDWQRFKVSASGEMQKLEIVTGTIEQIHSDPQIAVFTDFWAPPAALLYRRNIVEKIGGWNESLPVIQDARFLLDAALHGARFARCPGVGAYYRQHDSGSVSTGNPVLFLKDCMKNALQIEKWWSEHGGISDERHRALLKVLGYVARSSFEKAPPLFDETCEVLERLEPGYLPARPVALYFASKMLGYRRAERVALCYRKIKKLLISNRS